jgi:cellulose synthase/poly-beta-1,6-N-acetylglucosamine synthase-like glycosyltransferase
MTQVSLFLICFALLYLAYAWWWFPLLLGAAARHRQHPCGKVAASEPVPPVVHIVIAAHNEEPVIRARIENLAGLDYPRSRMRVYVGTDGCTDGTAGCAREAAASAGGMDVRIHEFEQNRGKVAVLKALVAAADPAVDDVLVFSDANTSFEPDALTRLVHPLNDPCVGCVCGRLVLGNPGEASPEVGYWGMETRLKEAESILDSCLGANGAIYAMRAGLFWAEIPDNTIVDDFVLGMKVREVGRRVVYEPQAVAYEELPELDSEWGRRVRIGVGDYQALFLCRRALLPRFRWFAWCFLSHKVLRWFTPHVFVAGAVGALLLPVAVSHVTLLVLFPLLAGGILLGAAWWGQTEPGRGSRICSGLSHFMMMNAGLLCGFWRWSRGGVGGAWQRTPRRAGREGS